MNQRSHILKKFQTKWKKVQGSYTKFHICLEKSAYRKENHLGVAAPMCGRGLTHALLGLVRPMPSAGGGGGGGARSGPQCYIGYQ